MMSNSNIRNQVTDMSNLRPTFRACVALALMIACSFGQAEESLKAAPVFTDHMVLQRDRPIPVWGWARSGENVILSLGGQTTSASADAKGCWRAELPALPAGGPHVLTIAIAGRPSASLAFQDVLIGEVWICSGQSNMAMTVLDAAGAEEEIAQATSQEIRHFRLPPVSTTTPSITVGDGHWAICDASELRKKYIVSAVAYSFARELHARLKVPVGVFNASYGGSRIERWIPFEGYASSSSSALAPTLSRLRAAMPTTPEYKRVLGEHLKALDLWRATAGKALASELQLTPPPAFPKELEPFTDSATGFYNGCVNPAVGYGLRGAIWYQGEANYTAGQGYLDCMQALVQGWRMLWRQGDFPFHYVQIAPFDYGDKAGQALPAFWEIQDRIQQTIPGTSMVVINDLGDLADIHPKNKREVGRRLALLALSDTYGRQDVAGHSAVFDRLAVEEGRLRVIFRHTYRGLASRDGKPVREFELLGESGDYIAAEAVIEGNAVVLSSPKIAKPVGLRFAWRFDADPNLINSAGLPVGTFRVSAIPNSE